MFNNLIESSSHAKEFKRRGSFLLVTTATYLVLLVAGGVVSVYAYDAHLESQNTELEITFVPLREAETPPPPKNTVPADANRDRSVTESVRPVLYDSVNNPTKVPPDVSSKAQPIPPATKFTRVGDFVAEPPTTPGSVRTGPGSGSGTVVNIPDIEPPPAPEPKPEIPKVLKVSTGVLSGKAVSLQQPTYPRLAVQIGLKGSVSVQVLIDEGGKVVSAEVISGHPVLAPEAKRAALQSRFTPTKLSGMPVKVSGVIVYKFGLQ